MEVYEVTLRHATGRERVERVSATTAQNASNMALIRVEKALNAAKGDWMVVHAIAAYS